MAEHAATLDEWYGALTKAFVDRAHEQIPTILVRMARDGWGAEADVARRILEMPPRDASSDRLGHSRHAYAQVEILRDLYRSGGHARLRSACSEVVVQSSREWLITLLGEAVLVLEETQRQAARDAMDRTYQMGADQ